GWSAATLRVRDRRRLVPSNHTVTGRRRSTACRGAANSEDTRAGDGVWRDWRGRTVAVSVDRRGGRTPGAGDWVGRGVRRGDRLQFRSSTWRPIRGDIRTVSPRRSPRFLRRDYRGTFR